MPKHIAVYVRVSTKQQETKNQHPAIENWLEQNAKGQKVKWYEDKASGKDMERPGWQKLETAIKRNRVSTVVVWKFDRLARSVLAFVNVFEFLNECGVKLVSIHESFDVSTSIGKAVATFFGALAELERSGIRDRVIAGQARARANGKTWGGSKKGRRLKVTKEREQTIFMLKDQGLPITRIADTVGVSRQTIYRVLENAELPQS